MNRVAVLYIDDCLAGSGKLMASEVTEELNIGRSETVSINQLVDIVEDIARIKMERRYNLDAPLGVNVRSSDNTLIEQRLQWQPTVSLRQGMERTNR